MALRLRYLAEFDDETGEKLSEEEQANHRDENMRDYGVYRTAERSLAWPHLAGLKGSSSMRAWDCCCCCWWWWWWWWWWL